MLFTVNSLRGMGACLVEARYTENRCALYSFTGADKYVALLSLLIQIPAGTIWH